MKVAWTLTALGLLLAGPRIDLAAEGEAEPAPKRSSGRAADEKAIREAGAAFVRAYNAGDARAIADLFTEDAEAIDEDGRAVQGREAITALFAAVFEDRPGESIEVDVDSLRFLGPDTAKEEGRSRIIPARSGPRGEATSLAPEHGRYTVLYVRQDGRWLQASVREHPSGEMTPHERLEPLAWLIGDWVDEGSDSVVFTTGRWSDDGNFLLRDFTIQVQGKPAVNGTQRIGWDPLTKQIKSWVFDSEGGHGEGLWAGDGRRWVVKGSGVLRDGRTATATHVYSIVSPDMVRWKSIDRTVGDRVEPDINELVMVRKPPRPR